MKILLFTLSSILISLLSSSQGIYNNGAHIVSQGGSYWVVGNGHFTFTSPSAVNLAVTDNLEIEANASLEIAPTSFLTVNGTLINNAGNGGLVLNSSVSGTASLINGTAGVAATVKRFIPGISQAWHLVSSPVANQAISPGFTADPSSAYDFYAWYEPTATWVNFKNTTISPTWTAANGSSSFITGKGYLVEYLATNPTKQFLGNLNTGLVTFNLTNSGTGAYKAYNLVGNPYSSAIDWKAAGGWTRSFLELKGGGYDMSIWNDAAGGYGTYNSASLGDDGTLGASRYIPVGQGFMILAKSPAGVFSMDNEIKVHDDQSFLKSTSEIANILRLKVTSDVNAYSDEIVIEFGHPGDTGGAEKIFTFYETAPSLYTEKPDGDYSMDFRGAPTTLTIPVEFRAGVDGRYTIAASQLGSFTSTTIISLEDLEVHSIQNLMQNPSYNFTASKSDAPARFLLHFGGTFSVSGHENVQPFNIYGFGNSVCIANISGVFTRGDVTVYNMIGQVMAQRHLDEWPLVKLSLPGCTGYYLVKVITGEGVYTGRVLIH